MSSSPDPSTSDSAPNVGPNGTSTRGSLPALLARVTQIGLIFAVVGLIICATSAFFSGAGVLRSYLTAYLFWLGLPVGSIGLLLVNHLAGGTWGLVIRKPLEASAATIPIFTVLFLPIAFSLGLIFPWAGAEYRPAAIAEGEAAAVEAPEEETGEESADETAEEASPLRSVATSNVIEESAAGKGHKALYFNRMFVYGRMLFYFIFWNLAAAMLVGWSRQQDKTGDPVYGKRLSRIGAPGLLLFFVTVTFAAFDWLMALNPVWFSTIFGAMMIVGMGLMTFAAMNFFTTILVDRGEETKTLATPKRLNDLGNLQLAFIMLWAYVAYSQFLIIWSGDLTEENPFYILRTTGGWTYLTIFLAIFHFFFPFLVLLFRSNKEKTARLRLITGWIFVVHAIDLFWLAAPSMAGYDHPIPKLSDFGAFAAIGGLWVAAFAWFFGQGPLLPKNDPDLVAVLADDQAHGAH